VQFNRSRISTDREIQPIEPRPIAKFNRSSRARSRNSTDRAAPDRANHPGETTEAALLRPQFSLDAKRLPALRTARSAATTTTAAASALLSLIDLQRSPVDIVAIQGLHGTRSICARHFNEAKAAGPTGVAIIDQRNRLYGAMLFEQRAYRGLVH
jgi:hypothetical protein